MKVSLIVTGGFIRHENKKKAEIETERLLALNLCLMNLGQLDTSKGDEIVFAEYGEFPRLRDICHTYLKKVRHKYVFVEGIGFNQSAIKNYGTIAADNEIVCWINSDVIVQKNIFDVIRSRFEKNPRIFVTAARHDVFSIKDRLKFLSDINQPYLYQAFPTAINDAGWHHALNQPRIPIQTMIKFFSADTYLNSLHDYKGLSDHHESLINGRIIHDFAQGYINYGELMAVTKEIAEKYPFDEEITALVDSYLRDIIFGKEEGFELSLIHNETSIFHLSGSDYMQQEEKGSDKHKRLIEDIIRAAKKHPKEMGHWLVLSYFREFDDTIKELNLPFKEILETWRTPFLWQYYRDRERVQEIYGVTNG